MNYQETESKINSIFTKVKNLPINKQKQLRRAYGIDFDELNGFQQLFKMY